MGDGHAPGPSGREDVLGADWESHRSAVLGVAYQLLGSVADTEDVTQGVWLRAAGADLRDVGDPRAWLVTVAARRSYDVLKSARFRRETYVGLWLPESLLTGPDASEPVLADESASSAMLLIMEELSPPERVAFVLHDVFGLESGRIAEVLDVSVPAARHLASRARRRVAKAKQSMLRAPKEERERVLAVFRAAYEAGDLAGLVRLLHPDAVYVTDGGGKAAAARKLIHGGERVAEVMARVGRQWRPDRIDLVEVGGEPALAFHRGGLCLLRGHAADHRRSDNRVPQGHQPGQAFSSPSCHTPSGCLVSLMRTKSTKSGQTKERSRTDEIDHVDGMRPPPRSSADEPRRALREGAARSWPFPSKDLYASHHCSRP